MNHYHFLFRSFIATFAATYLFVPTLSTAAQEYTPQNPLIIKMTSFAMPTHPAIADGVMPWAEELKEKSSGRMVVEIYNPNTVCPDADVYDCVKSGVIDMGAQVTQRIKGTLPLSNVIDLPFMYPSAETGTIIFNQLLAEFPPLREEYAETKLFGVWTSAPFQLHTATKPLHTFNDVKGLKIAATGASIVPILQSLGAASANVPGTDVYMALQRRQVEGILCANAYMVSTKIYEATKYTSIVNAMGNGIYMCMNRQVYDSIPEDLKIILDASLTAERFRTWGRVTDEGASRDLATIEKAGQQVFIMPVEELAKGQDLSQRLVEDWYNDCAKRGKGDVAHALYKRAVELAAQYNQQ